jgi:hypothetical protein
MIGAHLDPVRGGPGIVDNGSGVANGGYLVQGGVGDDDETAGPLRDINRRTALTRSRLRLQAPDRREVR